MSYISVDPEAKSIRERYIRVAAIVIIIRLGIWNNCNVDDTNEKLRTLRHRLQRNVRCVIDLLFGMAPSPTVSTGQVS